jgi:hypothetical protein
MGLQEATCRKCGQVMQCVADIAPTACDPGLSAYRCTRCGHTTSVLVYARSGDRRLPFASGAPAEATPA